MGCYLFILYFWRIVLQIQNLWLIVFSFSALNMSCPRYTVSMVSDESAIVQKLSLLSCCFQDSPWVCGFWQFDDDVYVWISWVYLFGIHWANWRKRLFFIKLERFSAIIYSNILSVSSFLSTTSETPIIHMLRLLLVLYRSLRLCSFFCFSELIISMNCFQVHLVFLLPFRVYHWDWPWIFHISYCTFQLQGFHMIFNYFHFFIGILYLMRSLIFLLFFRHIGFLFFFFYHFGYIWIPYLKFLSSKSNVWSSSETVSIDCLHIVHLLYRDHAFLFIWMSHNFL